MIALRNTDDFGFANLLIRGGRFRQAAAELGSRRSLESRDALQFWLLQAELDLEVGRGRDAIVGANRCLQLAKAPTEAVTRARLVLAVADFQHGDVSASLQNLELAKKACGKNASKALKGYVAVLDFAIALNILPIESVFSRLREVRDVVAASGDAHLIVLLRIAVARAEARRASPAEALRHHHLAMQLLEREPNIWLEGLVSIDMAAIAMVMSDLPHSLVLLRRALQLSDESGHARTRVAALINTAQVLAWQGESAEARRHLMQSLHEGESNRHLVSSARDGLVNLLIDCGDFSECERILSEQKASADEATGTRPHWDLTSEAYSNFRLAFAQGRLGHAVAHLESALKLAVESGDHIWIRRTKAARAKCLGLAGSSADAIRDVDELLRSDATDVESSCRLFGSLAAVEAGSGRSDRALQYLSRAVRIAEQMTNYALAKDIATGFPVSTVDVRDAVGCTSDRTNARIDTAVALLDLAGHPHILARETFALLQEADCAEALALAAVGSRDTRLVAARGWSDTDALQAVRRAAADDLMTFGDHRGETWQILALPRPSLDHRCTLAAIRKLVAAARSLDHYRRDEKQRAALWPAEALDGDAESLWISEQSADLLAIARRIANAPLPILLTGETGTGKEMLARVIHRASARAARPLHPFNCTAVPREMLESQLFGHRKGAFTGADASFPGIIRAAAGGTLFLDEIGDVSLELQPKLLRFLEHGEIHPLGEPHPIPVDVRIIAATNANLEQLVAQGRFREDLLYRLNVMKLHLPPLRERREEIPPLLQHYIRKFADEQRKGAPTLSDDTLEYLLLYPWPGNLRQLANEVRRMIALAEPDATLTPALLSPEILAARRTIAAPPPAEPEIHLRLDQPLPDAVETLEQSLIRRALERSHGRVEEAARLLGISRKGLFLKRRRWGFETAERGWRTADRR